jgi:predicted HicB family RNase H-like nuclease
MKDTIEHEGFLGSVHFSSEDKCFFGKVEGIDDLISFEGDTVKNLTKNFQKISMQLRYERRLRKE